MPTILTAGYILEISGRVITLILVNQGESFAFTHVHSVKILDSLWRLTFSIITSLIQQTVSYWGDNYLI